MVITKRLPASGRARWPAASDPQAGFAIATAFCEGGAHDVEIPISVPTNGSQEGGSRGGRRRGSRPRRLNQCWELCSQIGSIVTCSIGHPAGSRVQIPASQWADGAKHHWPGTAGGTNPRRNVPRFITMMETGQLNMKALASATYLLARAREAYQAAADRQVVATIVTPTA